MIQAAQKVNVFEMLIRGPFFDNAQMADKGLVKIRGVGRRFIEEPACPDCPRADGQQHCRRPTDLGADR